MFHAAPGLATIANHMIISCPSCSTRYDMPASRFAAEGTLIKCAACGHSWLESQAIEIHTAPAAQLPVTIEPGFEPDHEIRRLVEATREAQEVFAARRRARLRRLSGWMSLAAAVAAPVIFAALAPGTVVSLAPASIAAYRAIGWEVNIYGLDLRRIETQHMVVDGTRVLAIRGEIANISGSEKKIPWLRFGLKSGTDAEVYNWTLDSAARPLRPGEVTSFVTRVASPPEDAANIEIRFAHAHEIGTRSAP